MNSSTYKYYIYSSDILTSFTPNLFAYVLQLQETNTVVNCENSFFFVFNCLCRVAALIKCQINYIHRPVRRAKPSKEANYISMTSFFRGQYENFFQKHSFQTKSCDEAQSSHKVLFGLKNFFFFLLVLD